MTTQYRATKALRHLGIEPTREGFDRLLYEFDEWSDFGDIIGARSLLSLALVVGLAIFDDERWLRSQLRDRMLACGMHPGTPTDEAIEEFDFTEHEIDVDFHAMAVELAEQGISVRDMMDVIVLMYRMRLVSEKTFIHALGNSARRESVKLATSLIASKDEELRRKMIAVCEFFDGVLPSSSLGTVGEQINDRIKKVSRKFFQADIDTSDDNDSSLLAIKFTSMMVGFCVAVYMGYFDYEQARQINDKVIEMMGIERARSLMPQLDMTSGKYSRGLWSDPGENDASGEGREYIFSSRWLRTIYIPIERSEV